ncbi:RNA polymerase factor sigma-54 [Sulfurimonas sp. HSL-3221]|uniref:RNA polymerase factor sigma-54 n=1 Tax=Thiomicrolovo sulfuroxydans TaxID=2894755 RepID=UPI001E2D0A34|nr:RNA polymerase factor sigma-54 [Sulfurimonas sp. HSL-3221]UFS61523.1 RNA polymerase factor sigma-54 [Sulfurimonas sp. HSL-3221]
MKQALNLKQKQLPRLSMQTWLPLLQCSLSDLDKHLQVISSENPCLEVSSGFEVSESSSDRSHRAYMEYQNHVSNASSDEIEWLSVSAQSLYEKLDEQIAAPLFPTPISQKIARQIIYYISDEGYFEGSIKEIAEQCDTDAQQVEKVRQRFAYLEPSGVGAKDYKESFLFQLNDVEMDDELSILVSAMITRFESMEKFVNHPRLGDAKEVISHLKNPPALEYMESEPPVLPDLYVAFEGGEFIIKMNNAFYPDLKVTQIDKYDNFAKQKFKEARELVKLLDLRKATLYNVTLVLLEKQYAFFMGGELQPLKLQDVADELGFNESTISRAISDKYLETERGVFAFKEFFSNAIGNVSTAEIKHFLERLVKSEDHDKPFSDKILHEKIEARFGISMVRRSIAKYRQELEIPPFKERRFLYKLAES